MKQRFVWNLNEVGREQRDEVGGKAANLGEMLRAELPVPGGFVVSTDAYRRFLVENDCCDRLARLLDAWEGEGIQEEVAEQIRELFAAGTIPPVVERAIRQSYDDLGRPLTVVRSSATAEDLPGASFAGQYSSFLNVQGPVALLQAIRDCWASLWNDRALAYRRKQGLENRGLAHGVVVQRLVDAEKSGILFTANPVNGRRDQLVLNAAWGIGESIVAGEVTPDQWVLRKPEGTVVQAVTAQKEVMTVRAGEGVRTAPVPRELQSAISLGSEEVHALARLGLQAEAFFGSPQDIEWAFADDTFYLVQSRPITSLYPLPAPRPGKKDLRVHLNINLYSQAMKEPFTPLGADLIREMAKDVIRRLGRKDPEDEETLWWFQIVGGRVFVDITEMLRNPRRWDRLTRNPND